MSEAWHYGGRYGPAPVVCHIGAWNGLGESAYQTWAFHRAEMLAFSETPFRMPEGERVTMAPIATLPPQARAEPRCFTMLTRLLDPLLLQIAGRFPAQRVGVALAVDERFARLSGHAERLLSFVREQCRERELDPLIELVPASHAGGVRALEWAAVGLRHQLDVAVVGGVSSSYDPDIVAELTNEARLHDGKNPGRFIPGEGGAFFTLTTRATARTLHWPVLLQVEGVSSTTDPSPGAFGAGLGLTRALRPFVDRLAQERRQVARWWSDMTNEHFRTYEFQLTYPRVASMLHADARVEYLARYLGDLGAASIPTALAVMAEGMRRADPGPSAALLTASSPGPERGAVLVSASR
ncbi:MAG: hypothetical protein AAGF12_07885 [Myxococcota bacterium]